jgi:putative ABC transport system permease protein
MFGNYFRIALRQLSKHKFYSIINISGLAIGIACCLLIFTYVKDELSYDQFHDNAGNIYRVGLQARFSGQEISSTNTCTPVGPAMAREVPGIESMTRLLPIPDEARTAFKNNDIIFAERQLFYADSNFFRFFSFKLMEGDKLTALKEPFSVVITTRLAQKYFKGNALGKTLIIGNNKEAYKITGIAEETPANSHFHFNALLSFSTVMHNAEIVPPLWVENFLQTYITKNPQTSTAEVNNQLDGLIDKYAAKQLEEGGLGITFAEFKKQGGLYKYFIYPLTDSHLRSTLPDDIEPGNDIRYVNIFSGIGIFILLLACINFMNLSTAQSAGRAKEVALRKTLGSRPQQLIRQFLSESFVYALVAALIAIVLCYTALPYFNTLAGKQLTLATLVEPTFIIIAFALIIIVGIIAGSYPAFYLASFKILEMLKGKTTHNLKSKGIRSTLVVFQFAVSNLLIIATIIVYLQLNHMQNKDLGLDRHNILTIQNTGSLANNAIAFKTAVTQIAGAEHASFTDDTFPGLYFTSVFKKKNGDVNHMCGRYAADWDQLNVMKFKLKAGRFFSREFTTDSNACVLNAAAAKELGLDNPIGQEIQDLEKQTPETLKVIGIVEDFNYESLKTDIRPLVIKFTGQSNNLLIRYAGSPQQLTATLETTWKQYAPETPFEYTFLDKDFDTLFHSEKRLFRVFTTFSLIAIFIACIGLFALAAFTTEKRTKEIGIRKVLGANMSGITLSLSKEFILLVLIAIVPSVALGWYAADWWLHEFPYRITLNPIIFVASALLSVFIATATVSYQSLKAAALKPVDTLRHE